ncbi:MAG: hypothetical protein EZS28_014255, partial [Streblomastix strix]
MGRTKAKL